MFFPQQISFKSLKLKVSQFSICIIHQDLISTCSTLYNDKHDVLFKAVRKINILLPLQTPDPSN